MSKAQQMMLRPFLMKRGINHAQVIFCSLEQKFPKYRQWKGKNKWVLDVGQRSSVSKLIAKYVDDTRAAAIVINEDVMLAHCMDQRSLDTCRGSVIYICGRPALVLDDVVKVHRVKEFSWIFQSDLARLKRYIDGTSRRDPRFVYTRIQSPAQLAEFRDKLGDGMCLSVDLETGKDFISSIAYTCLYNDGSINTVVVPHHCPVKESGCYWDSEDEEIEIWKIHKSILSHSILKTFQNGLYDCAWLVRYRIPVQNWLLDSLRMFHAAFAETYQSLEFITSFFVDSYRYWKGDIKGDKEEAKKNEHISTWEGMEIFWRYNGLDTYYTLLDTLYLSRLLAMPEMKWAKDNFGRNMRQEVGPCFAMTMRGMPCNADRQLWLFERWATESTEALDDLRAMADFNEFNPNSSQQFGNFLFDVLGAKPIQARGAKGLSEGKRSTDEKALKFVRLQHPLYAIVIDRLWEHKKPLNNIANYGKLEIVDGRMFYSLSLRTETGRYASSNHPFWYGRNIQNWPDEQRGMLQADNGYVIFDADYSQSDSYFVAFESGDEKMIANVLDPRDTHCLHGEFFFKIPYEKIYKAYKNKEDWAIHSTKGVRQLVKKIGHGANYRMRGMTMYMHHMGHEACMAAAEYLGYKDCHKWNHQKCAQFCQMLLDTYSKELYALDKWYPKIVNECADHGNKLQVWGGMTRLFFGNVKNDEGIQREISAFKGQGGTAGNINKAVDAIYYKLDNSQNKDFRIHIQAHDAIVGMVRPERFDILDEMLTIMREPITINGRTFNIPVECEVGLSWAKNALMKYTPGKTSYEDIQAHERKYAAKFEDFSFLGG